MVAAGHCCAAPTFRALPGLPCALPLRCNLPFAPRNAADDAAFGLRPGRLDCAITFARFIARWFAACAIRMRFPLFAALVRGFARLYHLLSGHVPLPLFASSFLATHTACSLRVSCTLRALTLLHYRAHLPAHAARAAVLRTFTLPRPHASRLGYTALLCLRLPGYFLPLLAPCSLGLP